MLTGTDTTSACAAGMTPRAILAGMERAGRVPPALIAPAALQRVTTAAAQLPSGIEGWGFECRLEADDERVDFGALITASGDGPRTLMHAAESPAATVFRTPAAAPIMRFCEAWSEQASALQRLVRFIFLELDCDAERNPPRPPSVFVRMPAPWEISDQRTLSDDVIYQTARSALALLSGAPLSADIGGALVRVFDALPAGGRILHVGLLLGRQNEIRIYASIPRERTRAYLRDVGLGRCADDVVALSDRYDPTKPIAEIQFDLQPGASPRVGVEIPCQHRVPAERTRRFGAVLEQLVRDGLCTSCKRDAVLEWPGIEPAPMPPQSPTCVLIREISHVKVVYEAGARVRAKAYVTVTPRLVAGN